VLEAGKWLDRVLQERDHGRGLELEDLSKRLAIDQLRVALSRPAERLYWVDVNPSERMVSHDENMLSHAGERAYPMLPAVLLKTLEEEALDPEERVRLCESDAHQFLEVRPVMALVRARQAVALLGDPDAKFSVTDPTARASAHITYCQVAFTLAFRKVSLPSEVKRNDLYQEASWHAKLAGRAGLETLIRRIGDFEREGVSDGPGLNLFGMQLGALRQEIEPWLLAELQPRSVDWLQKLEGQVMVFPEMVLGILATLYEIFVPMEAGQRLEQVRQKAIHTLIENDDCAPALKLLRQTSGADPKLVAQCQEKLGEFGPAAEEFMKAGRLADALRCYRQVPDFDKSLELLESVGKHPARESLLWVRRMRDLAAERPAEFQKVMLPAEKQLLEDVLQAALGVTRRKPAAKKARTAQKTPASKAKTRSEPPIDADKR